MAEQILDPDYIAVTAQDKTRVKDNASIYAALLKLIEIQTP